MRFRLLLLSIMILGLALASPAASRTSGGAFTVPPLATSSKIPAVLHGNWRHTDHFGYVWFPDVANCMWSPWDSMSFGRWVWVDQAGWGWSPMEAEWCSMMDGMPPTSVSPLGWGYDSWYGGWYVTLDNGYVVLLGDPNGTSSQFPPAGICDHHYYGPLLPTHQHRKPSGNQAQIVLMVPTPRPSPNHRLDDIASRGGAGYRGGSSAGIQTGSGSAAPSQPVAPASSTASSVSVPAASGNHHH